MKPLAVLVALPFLAPMALAPHLAAESSGKTGSMSKEAGTSPPPKVALKEARQEARGVIDKAAKAVKKMKAESGLDSALQRARGIYVVPQLLRGAFVVGASGGDGVLLLREDGEWSNPAFYSLGSVSLGPQAGGAVGPVAFILMSEGAVQRFRAADEIAFGAEAGLAVYSWSQRAEASTARGDVLVWSGAGGLFAGATVSAREISFDEEKNRAYYNAERVSLEDVLAGATEEPQRKPLQKALGEKLPR